ncbi:MAG: hypothetical protein IKU08_04355 [Clostridia bacterium]|nr:hypothetical protein [Clostridia bacterium]
MVNPVSNNMDKIVEIYKKKAEKALDDFDYEKERVQATADKPINLFGGTATKQVVDVAAESRRICDKLFATLQTLVCMVDEECKPLLNQQPSQSSVEKVADFIKWLNSESEIEVNFTASFNSRDLGNVANGRYIPKTECKMIQSYWETKNETWIDWIDSSQTNNMSDTTTTPVSSRTASSEFIKNFNIANSRQSFELTDEEAEYLKAGKRWREELAEAEIRRNEEIEKEIYSVQHSLETKAKREYDKVISSQTMIKQEAEQKIAEAQEKIRNSKFLQFSLRITQQEIIDESERIRKEAIKAINRAKENFDSDMARAAETASWKSHSIRRKIMDSYKMPEPPRKPASIAALQCSNDAIKKAICAGMEPDRLYTTEDIQREIPVAIDLSNQHISSLIKQMISVQLERVEQNRKAYFRVKK